MEKNKDSSLEKVLSDLNKKYGKGAVMMLGDSKPITDNLLSTGSLSIDYALGGGVGEGRITEVYGPESAGKTTLCLQIAAECQRNGGRVAYIDVENALDVEHARSLGVNVKEMAMSQPDSGEQALGLAEDMAKSGAFKLIIIDSVAALTPQAELDGDMGALNVGLLARLMSQAMRKLKGAIHDKNCSLIFINQIRENISTGYSAGPSETTPGGRALKFFASQRIELRKMEQIKVGDSVIGNKVKIKIVKNKIAAPMKTCVMPLIFGEGFSAKEEAIDLAIEFGLIEKAGAWFSTHDGQRMCGKPNVVGYYEQNPAKLEELSSLVRKKFFEGVSSEGPDKEYSDDEVAKLVVDELTGEVIE